MPLPAASFDVAETLYSGLSIIDFTPTGGVSTIFAAKELSDDPEQEEKSLDLPDIKGKTHKLRIVTTKENEKFTFGLPEVKRLLDLFDGSMIGRKTGVVKIYLPDPDDADGKCALVTESFPCTVSREGKIDHGNGEFSKSTIKIESNKIGTITWTKDGAV